MKIRVTIEDIEKYVPIYVNLFGEIETKEQLVHMINWYIETVLEIENRNSV
jgi:hypothetical protein